MLGNCHSAALVDHRGTIGWLCLPRFDSDAVFAALLGDQQHGQWALSPAADFRTERAYQDDSLVLCTRMITDSGTVELIDFMVASENGEVHQHLVRIVRCVQGSVPMHMRLTFRFNYGRTVPWTDPTRCAAARAALTGAQRQAYLGGALPRPLCSPSRRAMASLDLHPMRTLARPARRLPSLIPDQNISRCKPRVDNTLLEISSIEVLVVLSEGMRSIWNMRSAIATSRRQVSAAL